jgi:hypothetical protein
MRIIRTFFAVGLPILLLAGCATRPAPPPVTVEAPPVAEPPAPPPPEPSVVDSGEDIVTTASRGDAALPSIAPRAVEAYSARGKVGRTGEGRPESTGVNGVQRQSGILTAGDHDDLLNPQLYARYAAKYLQNHAQPALPLLDAASRIKIRVTDKAGRPAPFVRIDIKRSNAAPLVLTTAADGAISVFPALDGLPSRLDMTITAPGGTPFTRNASPVDRTIAIEIASAPSVRKFDLLLMIDTTGSMGDELSYLQVELGSIVNRLKAANPQLDLRIGLLAYRDEQDEYVTRPFGFTNDLMKLRMSLAAQRADGGGDYPEAVDKAMAAALDFDWRADAVKAMLFVADAPPHDDKMAASWKSAMTMRARGIHIVPVGASGVAEDAEYLMRSMAAVTQSRYIFLTDDSGVGRPHQDPDVPCYVVTRLDGLVSRVLAGLISGVRVEPKSEEIIRRVGDYDKGLCLASRRPDRPRPDFPQPMPRPRTDPMLK